MAEITIKVPWLQLDIPKITAGVLDRAMELSLEDFRNDTEFYDDESRPAHEKLMGEIQSNFAQHGIQYDGYTGAWPRYPKHMRDSWIGWNFINGHVCLYNESPAAGYLFHGNSPGRQGGPITPRHSKNMTFYHRTVGWRSAKQVRSVEMTGRMDDFRHFIFDTIKKNIGRAIDELIMPPEDGGVPGLLSDLDRRRLVEEINYLTRSSARNLSRWKDFVDRRSKVKPSSDEWDSLSDRIGSEYEDLYERRQKRKNLIRRLSKHREAEKIVADQRRVLAREAAEAASKQTVLQKTTDHVKKKKSKTTARKQPKTLQEKTVAQVEKKQEPPVRTKTRRFEDIRGLYREKKKK